MRVNIFVRIYLMSICTFFPIASIHQRYGHSTVLYSLVSFYLVFFLLLYFVSIVDLIQLRRDTCIDCLIVEIDSDATSEQLSAMLLKCVFRKRMNE